VTARSLSALLNLWFESELVIATAQHFESKRITSK
jgi:hypothetical protein